MNFHRWLEHVKDVGYVEKRATTPGNVVPFKSNAAKQADDSERKASESEIEIEERQQPKAA